LTGWSEPTKGKVTIWGYDVADEEQVVQVRHVVGYCPQYEIVFPNMTAMQHVSVYTTLKGVDVKPYGGLRPYAIHLLEKVGLEDVIDQNVDTYSGGI
jgi:ABC-type multidrug transport system ATPase subunit